MQRDIHNQFNYLRVKRWMAIGRGTGLPAAVCTIGVPAMHCYCALHHPSAAGNLPFRLKSHQANGLRSRVDLVVMLGHRERREFV